jgi:hypothetical protein
VENMKWEIWLNNKSRTVDERLFGIEPKIALQMRKMYVGETLYIKGYYEFQIIRHE